MLRCILRAKIHMATVTESNLSYDGSLTLDKEILKKAGILPYEQVMVSNLNNGERFETYVIPGKRGEVCLNGPTARKGVVGDKIIVFCYGYVEESKVYKSKPRIIHLDRENKILSLK
ncbi:MAG: aspartate 1-decarboxylase [Thermodesulfovibrionales bacterium]